MPTIYDNIDEHLEEGLNRTLETSKRADFCIGYFNLRGWSKVKNQIDKLEGGYLSEDYEDDNYYYCRVLIGMQKIPSEELKNYFSGLLDFQIDNKRAIELKQKMAIELKEQLTYGAPTNTDEKTLQKLAEQLREEKVVVKLHLRNTLHAKLYLAHRDDYNSPTIGFVGSSNLTFSGVSKQGELNVDVVEGDAANKLADWFQNRWEDRFSFDITEELAEIIENSWASEKLYQPYHVYLKIAYQLSSEARAGITEYKLPSDFEKRLMPFQQNAVKVAAHHLHNRGGVLIGDVVGLGKTITATALVKIFEDDFMLETLIICPKNLEEMWQDYIHEYRLRATTISFAKAQIQLQKTRRYRLVLIDESHNLRNREGKRYKAIQEYIRLNESKVIMLTATPYNKSYEDLSSQLRLFLDEDYNLGIKPERYIESIGGKVKFQANHQVKETSIAAFEKSHFSDDWSELMRLFLIRRTRSFIKNNYAQHDPDNGRKYLEFPDGTRSYFPERIPRKVEYAFNPNDPNDQYAQLYSSEVVNIINGLLLPRYGIGQVRYQSKEAEKDLTDQEKLIWENLSRAGIRLIGFARTNLFKRLESSGYSFLISISKHILRNQVFIYAIENNLHFPIGTQDVSIIDQILYTDKDMEEDSDIKIFLNEEEYQNLAQKHYNSLLSEKHKYKWIRAELFNNNLKKDLQKDCQNLMRVLEKGNGWKQENDRQLNALHRLITNEHVDQKMLVFTQYFDTANYLYESLKQRGIKRLDCVTGDHEHPTLAAQNFSPVSNGKSIQKESETRILITTDVLSEGQNLQDAHIVLNYDLPWALIRLIQRAGRIDRIGQSFHQILCYSFLPEDGIENIINLRNRLRNRISENAETVGSDEVFFEGDPVNIHDLYNEKSGILDKDEDLEIDLASYAYQIWKNATDEDPSLKKTIPELPNVIYATKKAEKEQELNGSIVYTKTAHGNDMLAWVDKNKQIVTQSQFEILRAVRCEPDETALNRFKQHHELVKTGLEHIKDIESKVGGQLGKKNGARYRVYMRMSNFVYNNPQNLWVSEELNKAIQDIYDHPLREYARETLNRHLKSGISDEDLASLLVSLREEGKLSLIQDEDSKPKEPQIICSMGLKVQ